MRGLRQMNLSTPSELYAFMSRTSVPISESVVTQPGRSLLDSGASEHLASRVLDLNSSQRIAIRDFAGRRSTTEGTGTLSLPTAHGNILLSRVSQHSGLPCDIVSLGTLAMAGWRFYVHSPEVIHLVSPLDRVVQCQLDQGVFWIPHGSPVPPVPPGAHGSNFIPHWAVSSAGIPITSCTPQHLSSPIQRCHACCGTVRYRLPDSSS